MMSILLNLYLTCWIYGNIDKNVTFEEFEYWVVNYGYHINIRYKNDVCFYSFNEESLNRESFRKKVDYIEFKPKYVGTNYVKTIKKEVKELLQ